MSNKVTICADRPSSKWFKPTLYVCKTTERGLALGAGVAVLAAYEEAGLHELEGANFGSGVELAAGREGPRDGAFEVRADRGRGSPGGPESLRPAMGEGPLRPPDIDDAPRRHGQ